MASARRHWAIGLGLLAVAQIAVAVPVAPATREAVPVDPTLADVSALPADGTVKSTTATRRVPPTTATDNSAPVASATMNRRNETTAAVLTRCPGIVASIAWPPGWHVDCTGPRDGLRGVTYPQGSTSLYIRPRESDTFLRVVALHEAGHAWDFARLDDAKIARWCALRGCDAARFFSGGGSGRGWKEPPAAEDWAAVWNACHSGSYHRSYLGLAAPTANECALQRALVGVS